jgi:hypothetical protein
MIRVAASIIGILILTSTAFAQFSLENPSAGSTQSGIGLISGWKCTVTRLTVAIDDGAAFFVPYGSARGDTQGVCNDSDNGFGILVNWNLFGNGPHTIRLFDGGTEFASATFTVQTLGGEFLTGLNRSVDVPNFPGPGQTTTFSWSQAAQNLVVTGLTGGGGGGGICTAKSQLIGDFTGNELTVQITNPCSGGQLFWTLTTSPANDDGVFFCSLNIAIVQGSAQYEEFSAFTFTDNAGGGSVCTSIPPGVSVSATLRTNSGGSQLNFTQPFSVFYDDVKVGDFP